MSNKYCHIRQCLFPVIHIWMGNEQRKAEEKPVLMFDPLEKTIKRLACNAEDYCPGFEYGSCRLAFAQAQRFYAVIGDSGGYLFSTD